MCGNQVCLSNEIIYLITMKTRLKMENIPHLYKINRTWSRHGHKCTKHIKILVRLMSYSWLLNTRGPLQLYFLFSLSLRGSHKMMWFFFSFSYLPSFSQSNYITILIRQFLWFLSRSHRARDPKITNFYHFGLALLPNQVIIF